MQYSQALIVAALVALAQAKCSFTSTPSSVEAGKSYPITWSCDAAGPVNIVLRKGSSSNLDTVSTLTSSASGTTYTWNVDKGLANAPNYALEITQGTDVNYSGQFGLTGGSAAAASSASGSSSAAASSTITASAQSSALSSISSAYSSMSASLSSAAANGTANGTATSTASRNSTGSSTASASASSGSSSRAASASASSSASKTGSASAGGASASNTQSTSAPTATGTSGAGRLASPIALVLGAVAAMIYLR